MLLAILTRTRVAVHAKEHYYCYYSVDDGLIVLNSAVQQAAANGRALRGASSV
jgi:hypothetical protein